MTVKTLNSELQEISLFVFPAIRYITNYMTFLTQCILYIETGLLFFIAYSLIGFYRKSIHCDEKFYCFFHVN